MKLKRPNSVYGWYVVAAVFVISAFVSGIVSFGFTAVVDPIADEFGWSYASISFAGSIRGLEIGLLAPIIGILIDRIGARILIFVGGLFIGLGLLTLSHSDSLFSFYASYMMIAAGMSTCIGVVPVTVVGYWFERRIVLVTGIVVSGVAMGGFFVRVVTFAIDALGWRGAMMLFGLSAWAVILPIALLVKFSPSSNNGDQAKTQSSDSGAANRMVVSRPGAGNDKTVRQALTSRFFWHVQLAFLFHVFAVHAVTTHVMPYLNTIDINRSSAGWIAGLIPVISIFGRLSFGWLGDRCRKHRLTAGGIALTFVSLLMFGFIDQMGPIGLAIFIVLFSIGYGGPVPMIPNLLRERFGRAHIGAIIGASQGIAMIGSITGQPLAGWLFDVQGTYRWTWLIFAAANLLGILSLLTTPYGEGRMLKKKTLSENERNQK